MGLFPSHKLIIAQHLDDVNTFNGLRVPRNALAIKDYTISAADTRSAPFLFALECARIDPQAIAGLS